MYIYVGVHNITVVQMSKIRKIIGVKTAALLAMANSMTTETFIAEVLEDNRITIPRLITEEIKVGKGNRVRVIIQKVR